MALGAQSTASGVSSVALGKDSRAENGNAIAIGGDSDGNGYGAWQRNTFRIANFPAILDEEYEELKRFFLHYYA